MRVGLEGNVCVSNDDMAKGNFEMVEWDMCVAQVIGREPASPDEAREIMGLREKV